MKNGKINLPKNLEKETKEFLNSVVSKLEENELLEATDGGAIWMLAKEYNRYIIANKQLDEDGLTVSSDRGNVAPHPCIKISKDSFQCAMAIITEFGLTLKSRGKLKTDEKIDEETPFDLFLKNGVEKREIL